MIFCAGMVKLANTTDLRSVGLNDLVGSSPTTRTILRRLFMIKQILRFVLIIGLFAGLASGSVWIISFLANLTQSPNWAIIALAAGGVLLFYVSSKELTKKRFDDVYGVMLTEIFLLLIWIVACVIAFFY